MIWLPIVNFFKSSSGRTFLAVVLILIGVIAAVHYIKSMAQLEFQLEGEKQINRNLSTREQIDENVKNKSDYDVCIANGGLHNDCK